MTEDDDIAARHYAELTNSLQALSVDWGPLPAQNPLSPLSDARTALTRNSHNKAGSSPKNSYEIVRVASRRSFRQTRKVMP
jgi:hypothetical protein